MYATIERKAKNIVIYSDSPKQSYAAVRTARVSKQLYIVDKMTCKDFINFKGMASSVTNLSPDDGGEIFFFGAKLTHQ